MKEGKWWSFCVMCSRVIGVICFIAFQAITVADGHPLRGVGQPFSEMSFLVLFVEWAMSSALQGLGALGALLVSRGALWYLGQLWLYLAKLTCRKAGLRVQEPLEQSVSRGGI